MKEKKKHVEFNCHQVQDRIVSGLIKTLHVRSENQLAGVFTKPLFPGFFQSLIDKINSVFSPSKENINVYDSLVHCRTSY